MESYIYALLSENYLIPIIFLGIEELGLAILPEWILIAYVGYQVSLGKVSFLTAYLLVMTSVLLGSTLLYLLSLKYGQKLVVKIGKYIFLDEQRLVSVERKFKRFGFLFLIFGRHIIGLHIPITIFSGMSRIRFRVFILCTIISSFLWIYVLLQLGAKIGRKTIHYIHASPIHWIYVLATILGILVTLELLKKRGRKSL